jgi:hypothetical protein
MIFVDCRCKYAYIFELDLPAFNVTSRYAHVIRLHGNRKCNEDHKKVHVFDNFEGLTLTEEMLFPSHIMEFPTKPP